jgi:hypothetical protein
MTEQNVRAALDATANSGTPDQPVQAWQSFQEFQLSRSGLFAGRAGGLRAIDPEELDFQTPFLLWMLDEFENREARAADRPFSARSQSPVMKGCFACHSLPGVASFNSYFNYRDQVQAGAAVVRPFSLSEMPVSEVAGASVKWKEGRPNWAALRKLLEE